MYMAASCLGDVSGSHLYSLPPSQQPITTVTPYFAAFFSLKAIQICITGEEVSLNWTFIECVIGFWQIFFYEIVTLVFPTPAHFISRKSAQK